MFRSLLPVALVAATFVLADGPAFSKVALPAAFSLPQKVAQAEAVVTGKITEIEKDDMEVLPFQGAPEKQKMKVAVIKIDDGLIGVKNVTHVKVLFQPPAAEQPADPGIGRPIIRRGGFAPINLQENDEGLYFLAQHPTAPGYYTIQPQFAPVSAKADTFKADLSVVKATVATLADPMKSLKAESAEDRLSAAATLVQKYRRGLSVPSKEEAIPAEETKAILRILADADWTAAEKPRPQPAGPVDYQAQPQNLVSMLGLYPGANGFPQFQPKPGESYPAKYQEAFKTWLAKDGAKFEIKKYVPAGK